MPRWITRTDRHSCSGHVLRPWRITELLRETSYSYTAQWLQPLEIEHFLQLPGLTLQRGLITER